MVLKKWSGIDMWECRQCGGTTFSESEAGAHVCKTKRFSAEETETEK